MTKQKILLIEPGYPSKYPPLGLMKLAAYHGPHGRDDIVQFVKGDNHEAALEQWDRVYVTTLFSFEWKRTAAAIDLAIRAASGQREKVFVGGIAASLMHNQFSAEPAWQGIRFIRGLLEQAPAPSLMLLPHEFGADDTTGNPIEELTPDYSILEQTGYKYPVQDAYFGYASRGCVRKCSFCGVPKLEGELHDMPPLHNLVNGVSARHGEKKDLILMDNNVTASPRFREIIDEIVDLGFGAGATITRPGRRPVKRRVDFNQGVDARILCKSPMFLREMSRICISPLRIAFDHIGIRKQYETSIRMAADHGLSSLSNYMLYNFHDSPVDLYQRMALNITLNHELGVSIWSFPMRYQPVTLRDRSHVGAKWCRYQLRSFQLMLQATRGVISGNADFFGFAYGQDATEFERLLGLPHAFLFNRQHYLTGEGAPLREEYEGIRANMSNSQSRELLHILSGPTDGKRPSEKLIASMDDDKTIDALIRAALRFHAVNHEQKATLGSAIAPLLPWPAMQRALDDEQRVEDAGLYESDPAPDPP